MPLLDSVRDEFTDRNALLYLLLGMVSTARRLDRVLSTVAPRAPAPRAEGPEVAAAASSADRIQDSNSEEAPGAKKSAGPASPEPLVLLALGLISFRNTLMRGIEPVAAAHAARPTTPDDTATDRAGPALGRLLR